MFVYIHPNTLDNISRECDDIYKENLQIFS